MAVDALVFEFMGLAMLALCIIVLAVPSAATAGPAHQRHLTDPVFGAKFGDRPPASLGPSLCAKSRCRTEMQGSNSPQDP